MLNDKKTLSNGVSAEISFGGSLEIKPFVLVLSDDKGGRVEMTKEVFEELKNFVRYGG